MRIRTALIGTLLLQTIWATPASPQWDGVPKAALPAWPLWWDAAPDLEVGVIPLAWTSEVDGSGEGCCVIGAAARRRTGPATVWLGIGFGTSPDAGSPAALEAAVAVKGGVVAFRRLHGRNGFAAFLPLFDAEQRRPPWGKGRLSLGVSGNWIYDDRYLDSFISFRCPSEAPAAPCEQIERAWAWSEGRDYALALEGTVGDASTSGPRVTLVALAGIEALDGDHDYLKVELQTERVGTLSSADWRVGLAAGWVSGDAPLQRRFHLGGSHPLQRWMSPFLDAEGALFADVPYFTPGSAGLRAYSDLRPLVKRYVAGRAEIGRSQAATSGIWGRFSLFVEGAFTPALPQRLGPDDFDLASPILFDWRQLPAGEGEARGRFMARVLEVPELWGDAGVALTAGYKSLSITVASPLWASEPALADEPAGGGQKKALALRWSLSVALEHRLGVAE